MVHGASGRVGLAAIDFTKAMGARVIAATGLAAKAERIAAACIAPMRLSMLKGAFAML